MSSNKEVGEHRCTNSGSNGHTRLQIDAGSNNSMDFDEDKIGEQVYDILLETKHNTDSMAESGIVGAAAEEEGIQNISSKKEVGEHRCTNSDSNGHTRLQIDAWLLQPSLTAT